jgi:cobalt/nickel transport system permease protein
MGAGHAHALYVHEHSPVHAVAPHVKIVAVVTFVFAVAITPREAVWAFAIHAVALGAVIRLARVPPSFVLARMVVIVPFLLMALLLPFVAVGDRVVVFGVPMAVEGLWGAWNVAAKASLGAASSLTLTATTEVPQLLRGLERLKVPSVLTQIAAFMVRYLEVVLGELSRQRTAMLARGYDPRWLWQARAIAASAGSLFIRSYERGERVYGAMLARGYDGAMPPPLVERPTTRREWLLAALLPLTAATTVTLAFALATTGAG